MSLLIRRICDVLSVLRRRHVPVSSQSEGLTEQGPSLLEGHAVLPAANRGKHGVTFEQAGTLFRESLALTGYRDVPAPKYAEDIADATDEEAHTFTLSRTRFPRAPCLMACGTGNIASRFLWAVEKPCWTAGQLRYALPRSTGSSSSFGG